MRFLASFLFRLLLPLLLLAAPVLAKPLRVCATTPDLGDLARAIGGRHVETKVFTRGPEDPHFVEAKPSFVRALNRADLLLLIGMDLEIGWLPVLVNNARNRKVLRGNPGYVDCSQAINPKEVPRGAIDRSMGDVHAAGNPHYLLDPENGKRVAHLIRNALVRLRPDAREEFDARYEAFAKTLDARLEKWRKLLLPCRGAKVVTDHRAWVYFLDRFGLESVGELEPKPGVQPTSRHLADLVRRVRKQEVRAILTFPYFSRRYGDLVAEKSGAKVVRMAHQTGAVKGADSYLEMIDHNVKAVAAALAR